MRKRLRADSIVHLHVSLPRLPGVLGVRLPDELHIKAGYFQHLQDVLSLNRRLILGGCQLLHHRFGHQCAPGLRKQLKLLQVAGYGFVQFSCDIEYPVHVVMIGLITDLILPGVKDIMHEHHSLIPQFQ